MSTRICSMCSCGRRLYLHYAERFLDASQIDEVDLTKIPGFSVNPD